MNSPVAGGGAPESFFSPGQAERGQAGAGRAAAAGVTAGACPGCAGGAGNQGDAGRGPCAGGACQGCDPLQEQHPWTNWTGSRNTVQPDLVNQGTAQSFQNQGMVFPPGVGVPVPPSSCSHGSGSGGGSVGPQPGMFVPPMPVYGYGPPRTGMGVVNPTLQMMNQRPGNMRNQMAGNGLQNGPMQCGSNFDRVTQIQQLLQGLNARELQQVFKTLKDWLMVTTSVLFPIVWGMFHLSLEGGSYLMRLVIYLVWGLVKADLRVEMFSPVVRSGWVLVPQ